jgi:6-phospho-beta-glucosidase
MAIEQALLDEYSDPELDHKPAHLDKRGGAYYSEAAAALMTDLVRGEGAVHVVNVPNRGAIPGLPDDVVVEVSAVIGPNGPEPVAVPPLRADMDALIRLVKDFELLTVQAAVDGDEEAALRALVTNPLGPAMSNATEVWAALQEANAGWLGRLG